MKEYEIAIVGAGASGLMAAYRAGQALKRRGKSGGVILLDGNPKPGKKLLATGNGRCNLTNLHISPEKYHGDLLAAGVLEQYPAQKILAEFEKMGLLCRADAEGRAYPRSLQAAAVLQALWNACERAGAETAWGFEAVSVIPEKQGFLLKAADGRELWAKNCVLACGGMASPKHSRGKGYALAESLGHTVTPMLPSLVPLRTASKSCKALKGMRCKARAALYRNGREIYAESGEVIFGDGQLSGICVFNLSARLRETGMKDVEVSLDLLEDLELPVLLAYLGRLQKACPDMAAPELFSGALNLRVGQELAKLAGLSRDRRLDSLAFPELERAAKLAKGWRFPITGTGPWEDAQVTAGGVPLSEIDLDTMGSKICPGLYLAGELLDVDGDCGGFNLHWAWATGMIAGKAAGNSL